MTRGFIRRRELTHPKAGTTVLYEIVTLHPGGRTHRTSEGWETKPTFEEAEAEAQRRGIELVEEP